MLCLVLAMHYFEPALQYLVPSIHCVVPKLHCREPALNSISPELNCLEPSLSCTCTVLFCIFTALPCARIALHYFLPYFTTPCTFFTDWVHQLWSVPASAPCTITQPHTNSGRKVLHYIIMDWAAL